MIADPAPADEAVTFSQYQLPGLPAGVYQLGVSVRVDASDGGAISDQPLAASYRFGVTGDRFGLSDPAGTIAALFPADNASGEFDAVFPHVVLSKPRLPWTRYPATTPPSAPHGRQTGVPTWLAVLVLDNEDVPAAEPFDLVPAAAAVGDLFPRSLRPGSTLGPRTYSYFSRKDGTPRLPAGTSGLDPGQSYADAITVIDLPLKLFAAIAPTCADLELTAHVRSVSVVNKPAAAGAAPGPAPGRGGAPEPSEPVGTYSVVLSNRLPAAKAKSHAYLVSLEGLAPFLPTDPEGGHLDGVDLSWHIRLAVLAHWTFFSTGSAAAFDTQLESLNGRHPSGPPAANANVRLHRAHAAGAVATALDSGYVPLDHELRSGGAAVSWYRGPLSATAAAGPPPELPINSPDAAMVFDPTTGMLDVSLAAAWTLGRLMALDDTTFSTALYNWKQGLRRDAIAAAERRLIEREFGPLASVTGAANTGGLPLLHHAMSLLARSEPS